VAGDTGSGGETAAMRHVTRAATVGLLWLLPWQGGVVCVVAAARATTLASVIAFDCDGKSAEALTYDASRSDDR